MFREVDFFDNKFDDIEMLGGTYKMETLGIK